MWALYARRSPCYALLVHETAEQVVQRLRERGVREDSFLEDRIRHLAQHGDLHHRHELPAFEPQADVAEYLVALRVDHGLHEAACLVNFVGPRHVLHLHLRHPDLAPLLARLVLAYADVPELWVYIDRVRHQLACGSGVASLDQVGSKNAEIIVRNMGER